MLLTICPPAQADFPWQGAQSLVVLGGEIPLTKDRLGLRASAHYFTIPSADPTVHMGFSYLGPRWQFGEHLWISPQIGVALNWQGQDAFIASLWLGLSFLENQLTIFIEGDIYLNGQIQDFYGFYSLDYQPFKWFKVGLQGEQVDKGIMFGPHVGFGYEFWAIEVQYYIGLQHDVNYGQTVRIVNCLNF